MSRRGAFSSRARAVVENSSTRTRILPKPMQANANKRKRNDFLWLSFTFRNWDFSKGYAEKIRKNFPRPPTRARVVIEPGIKQPSGSRVRAGEAPDRIPSMGICIRSISDFVKKKPLLGNKLGPPVHAPSGLREFGRDRNHASLAPSSAVGWRGGGLFTLTRLHCDQWLQFGFCGPHSLCSREFAFEP